MGRTNNKEADALRKRKEYALKVASKAAKLEAVLAKRRRKTELQRVARAKVKAKASSTS